MLTSFCAESSEKKVVKKIRLKHHISWTEWCCESEIAQNNLQVYEGGITVKPGQDSIHELIIWKVNPFVASVTCSRYQIAFKWSVNFWLQLLSIRWDGKYFNGWNFFLDLLQIHENWASRNFITNLRVYSIHCSIIWKQKCRLKSTTTNGWWHFGQSERRKSSFLSPIQSEKSPDAGFFACDMSNRQKTDYRDEGRGHDCRLTWN